MSENINTPANVQELKTTLDTMTQQHCKTGKTHLWDVAVSINRTNAVPLDKSSIIFEDDVTKTEGDTTITIPGTTIEKAADKATAYPGQIISGLKAKDGKVYVLQPDGHTHSEHPSTVSDDTLTYPDPAPSSLSSVVSFEELATQSNVDYQVNKEAYQRQVANNARKNTETQIAKFILESSKNKNTEIKENGDITLTLPEELSDTSSTNKATTKTVLDYVVETVAAEKTVRKKATEELAKFIGTDVTTADKGDTILSGLKLPEILSNQTETPTTVKTLLDYIQKTVDVEVKKRYDQDKILLDCINELTLNDQVISADNQTNLAEDGVLTINLKTKLRDSSKDETNPPLITKYNN